MVLLEDGRLYFMFLVIFRLKLFAQQLSGTDIVLLKNLKSTTQPAWPRGFLNDKICYGKTWLCITTNIQDGDNLWSKYPTKYCRCGNSAVEYNIYIYILFWSLVKKVHKICVAKYFPLKQGYPKQSRLSQCIVEPEILLLSNNWKLIMSHDSVATIAYNVWPKICVVFWTNFKKIFTASKCSAPIFEPNSYHVDRHGVVDLKFSVFDFGDPSSFSYIFFSIVNNYTTSLCPSWADCRRGALHRVCYQPHTTKTLENLLLVYNIVLFSQVALMVVIKSYRVFVVF